MSEEQTPTLRRLSLKYREERILLEEQDGTDREYLIREFPGDIRDQYLNSQSNKVRISPDGKSASMKDFTGLAADLLVLTLFDVEGKTPVNRAKIQKFPAGVQLELFKIAQEVCSLNKMAQDQAKND